MYSNSKYFTKTRVSFSVAQRHQKECNGKTDMSSTRLTLIHNFIHGRQDFQKWLVIFGVQLESLNGITFQKVLNISPLKNQSLFKVSQLGTLNH